MNSARTCVVNCSCRLRLWFYTSRVSKSAKMKIFQVMSQNVYLQIICT